MRLRLNSVLIVLILGFSLVLRLPLLNGSFWLDEAAQALESARPLSEQLQIQNDFQPPLFHLIVYALVLISRQEWWLRLSSLVPGLITIWVVYEIGARLKNKRVGLLAAGLLATSSLHIFYSQELRPYALPTLWAALSWLTILNWHHQKVSVKSIATFLFISILGIYTSYLYPFLLAAQLVYLFVSQRQRRTTLLVSAGVMISFIPWWPMFLGQLQAGQQLKTALPGWADIVGFNQFKSLALIAGKFLFGVISLRDPVVMIGGVGLILLTLGVVGILLKADVSVSQKRFKLLEDEVKKYRLILYWLILPILLAWLVSFAVPILQPKRVLFCLPALYLLLAWIGDDLFDFAKRNKNQMLQKMLGFGMIGLFLLQLASVFRYWTVPAYQREDWRGMYQEITRTYPADRSAVVMAFPAPFAPWEWYDDKSYPTFATGSFVTDSSQMNDALKKVTKYQFMLVFDYLRDLTDPQNLITTQLREFGYEEVGQITPVTPLGIVHVFAQPRATLSLN